MSDRVCVEKSCIRKVWDEVERKSRFCIDHHPSGLSAAPLRKQLQEAKDHITDLDAELRATRAVVVTERMEKKSDEFSLLERTARAFLDAQEATRALTGAPSSGSDTRPAVRRRNDYPQPGASTMAARGAAKRLRRDIERALQTFEAAKAYEWRPPRPDPIPKGRCGTRGCNARDLEQPLYEINKRTGKRYGGRCIDCGTPLPGAVSDEEESA
jgi:hypothetical protein